MEYKIQIEKPALKQLAKIEKPAREKIRTAISNPAYNPRPHGYKKLADEVGLYRIKSGNYRVIYDVRDNILLVSVLRVAKRNERTYENEKNHFSHRFRFSNVRFYICSIAAR